MIVKGLIKGAAMFVAGAMLVWGLAGFLQTRASVQNEASAARAATVPAPSLAHSPGKRSAAHWMF